MIDPVDELSASEPSVTDRLRADILHGDLPPGERLIEVQLAQRYGVGRAAIRDALVELDGEGLIRREANRGASVRRLSVAEAIEITEARIALEGLAARLAAQRATEENRAALTELTARMEGAVANGDIVEYGQLNRQLHQRVCECSQHSVLLELVANLRNRAAHHQFRLSTVAGRPNNSLPEHLAIVAAVVAGDGDAAEAAMRTHLSSVVEVLRHWSDLGISV